METQKKVTQKKKVTKKKMTKNKITQKKVTPFSYIGRDATKLILDNLDEKDLKNVSLVNKELNGIAKAILDERRDYIWEEIEKTVEKNRKRKEKRKRENEEKMKSADNIDFKIDPMLFRLHPLDIIHLGRIDRNFNELLKNDLFWKERTHIDYPGFVAKKTSYETWRDFYFVLYKTNGLANVEYRPMSIKTQL